MAQVRVTARCYPTEDRSKIVNALAALFPDIVPSGNDPIVGTAQSVETFAELLKKQRIRSAARTVLRRGVSGDQIRFTLNKQVATVGKVSFSDDPHPLGDIEVMITAGDVERLIDEIAPLPGSEGGASR